MKDLEAPSVDLHTGVSSLDGTVTVEGTRRGAKARIDATVLFGKDSAQLRPGARARIRQVAKEFARKGPGKVRVVGYTDDLGPADHGLRLSIRRAGAVANTLADLLPARLPDDRGRQRRTGPCRPQHLRGEPTQEPPRRHHSRPGRRRQTGAQTQNAHGQAETEADHCPLLADHSVRDPFCVCVAVPGAGVTDNGGTNTRRCIPHQQHIGHTGCDRAVRRSDRRRRSGTQLAWTIRC